MNGFDAQDVRDTTGTAAFLLDLSTFPHWQKLRAEDFLTGRDLYERERAIAESIHADFRKIPISALASLALDLSKASIATDYLWFGLTGAPHKQLEEIQAQRLSDISQSGFKSHKVNAEIFGGERPCVLPYPIDDWDKASVENTQRTLDVYGWLFALPFSELNENLVQKIVHLGPVMPGTFPRSPLYHLLAQLHEMRHAMQVNLKRDPSDKERFYRELDADLFARNVFRQNGLDDGTLRFDLERAYILAPILETPYVHVLAIDAVENGEKPPTFAVCKEALSVVSRAILERMPDKQNYFNSNGFPPEKLASCVYIRKNPGTYFQLMMECYLKGDCRPDPLAEKFALRMLESVEHMAPELLRQRTVHQNPGLGG